MRISELGGETALVKLIQEKFGGATGGGLALGIGDDAALIEMGGSFLIVTTDLLIEHTHFRLDMNEPYLLGWKSVAVNISDIAAMGGVPTYAFVSIGLLDVDVSVVEGIYQGMRDASERFDSALAGGDTVGSDCGIVINVAQLGMVEREYAVRRTGARPGDAVIVTNTLGDSLAGLELLLKHGLSTARGISSALVERHLKPIPRVDEARAAVTTGSVTAMMDLSDGLASDLAKLCEASGVGAVVSADDLPISDNLRRGAEVLGRDPIEVAASGGEDYELLITCDQRSADRVIAAIEGITGSSATKIGEIADGTDVVLAAADGSRRPMPQSWQHF